MTDERIRLAEAFLAEAVFRSRAAQAAGVGLAGGDLDAPSSPANCGLGEKAAVVLDLSAKGEELFGRLWPTAPPDDVIVRIRDVTRKWVELQDALDRKRNHFLRDFRGEHGSDRRAYSSTVLAEYDTGLERVNGEVDERRRRAAEQLVRDA